jgi:hypothetical protein
VGIGTANPSPTMAESNGLCLIVFIISTFRTPYSHAKPLRDFEDTFSNRGELTTYLCLGATDDSGGKS